LDVGDDGLEGVGIRLHVPRRRSLSCHRLLLQFSGCSVLSTAVQLALAVDVGGTKVAAGIVDREGRTSRVEKRATPSTTDPEQMYEALAGLVQPRLDEPGLAVVGVGCGGPMSSGGERVSPLNIPAWRDFPLR